MRRRLLRTLCLAAISSCFLNHAFANNSIQASIEHTLNKYQQHAHIGIIISNAKTHRVIYKKNEQQLFTPASTQKLLTTTAALFLLKPNFRFATSLRSLGKTMNHTLHGNLYLTFTGDPTLNSKHLQTLLKHLKSKNITTITGNVVLVNNAYQSIPYPPGWVWDDLSYDYAAPLNTIILNKNRFLLQLTPGDKVGNPITLGSNLPDGTASFENLSKTTARYHKHCPISIYSNSHDEYTIRGCFLQSIGKQHRLLAIRNVAKYTQLTVKQLLAIDHIKLDGKVVIGTRPKMTKRLSTHYSKPLKHIIIHLLKDSDNLYADTLLKKMGEHFSHHPGSWQNGVKALEVTLKKQAHINFNTVHINDGAGLSRYNLLTPIALNKVLFAIYDHADIRQIMFHALPIAGFDGTLAARMKRFSNNERVRAKTGSMTGVTALAGFIKTKQKHALSFVILINGFTGHRSQYVRLENKLCELLVDKA